MAKIELLTSKLLEQFDTIEHFFSTRKGGFSQGQYFAANMSLKVGDNYALKNRLLLSRQINVPLYEFVFMQQVHADNVQIVTEKQRSRGAFTFKSALERTDALITARAGVMLIVTTADCVPILLYDRKNNVVAAVHSGWRGTVKQILKQTLQKMQKRYNSKPDEIYAAIGPSIGPCCYKVGNDVLQKAVESFGHDRFFRFRGKEIFFDLWEANEQILLDFGLPDTHIDVMRICTACHNNQFYSARRGDKGRQIAGIMIKAAE